VIESSRSPSASHSAAASTPTVRGAPPIGVALIVPRNGLRQWQVDAIKRAEQRNAVRVDAIVEHGTSADLVRDCAVDVLARIETVVRVGGLRHRGGAGSRGRRSGRAWCQPRREWPDAAVTSTDCIGDHMPVKWSLVINASSRRVPQRILQRATLGVVEFLIGDSLDIDDALKARRTKQPIIVLQAILVTCSGTTELARATASVRERTMLASSIDLLLARAALVFARAICAASRQHAGARPPVAPMAARTLARTSLGDAATLVATTIGTYGRVALQRLRSGTPRWFLAYRDVPAEFIRCTLTCSGRGLRLVMPPAGRFYADPCVFDHGGTDHVFFEDFDLARGKGVISWMQRDADGRFSDPEVVLEKPYHLAYPFVFAYEGAIYMVPDTPDVRQIQLFRATSFPRGWERVSVLLDQVYGADATLVEHAGRWWMFVTISEAHASLCDALFVYHADSPFGPWAPHDGNPVKVDVRSARPAGRLFSHDGRLIRPAQNCSSLYGGSVALCEVLELTTSRFRERVIADLGPSWTAGNSRFHTMSSSARVEFIDGAVDAVDTRESPSCVA
jgi:hypothetical protein